MVMTRILKKPHKHRLFVVLVALSFWIWLAKDIVFNILHLEISSGKLATVFVTVLSLLFIAGKLEIARNERIILQFQQKSLIWVLCFFCYCILSGVLTGFTAFTFFKLQNLLISIVIAYALAEKTIRAISMDKRLFFTVGLMIGLCGYYFVFRQVIYDPFLGYRGAGIAILNVQDFYVVLFLYVTTLALAGDFRLAYLFFLPGTVALCLPIIIALNSRMIPFTIGISFIYLAVALRSEIFNHRKFMRYALLLAVIALAGAMFVKDSINSDSRMMQIFIEGPIGIFKYNPRSISFNEAFNDFFDSPLYGIGFGKFVYPGSYPDPMSRLSGTWPHNIILELLSELGIIGFFLFAVPVGITLKRVMCARIKSNREFLVFSCLVFVYAAATMQVTQNIWYPFLWVGYFCSDAAFRYDGHSFSGLKKTHIVESSQFSKRRFAQ